MDSSTLLGYMPSYYRTSTVIQNINNANAIELTIFEEKLTDVLNQFFVSTATFTLERWEKEFGVEINNNLEVDFRRSRIKSKLRGSGTVTITLIKNVSEAFANGEVDIIEDNANYQFTVKFVGNKGIPPNLQDLKDSIERIKPAHLKVLYSFTYTTWGEVKVIIWAQVKVGTWGELKTREVI